MPFEVEIVLTLLSIAALILLIMGIFSVSQDLKDDKISSTRALLLTFGMLLVPLVGPAVWLWYRKKLN